MKILGIETSCDETAVCIIGAAGDVNSFSYSLLGNALYSQVAIHREYGGVFPNLAKREHSKNLVPLLQNALADASMLEPSGNPSVEKEKIDRIQELLTREPELFAHLLIFFAQYAKPDIDAIAVTHGPGLEPALWVGVNFARALSLAWDVPIVPVNHMEGHVIISAFGKNTETPAPSGVLFPALALLISGGHTELVHMPAWFSYERIGETRDDAVGEAFDKVGRLLGLPYPGGPEISKLAAQARAEDTPRVAFFTRPMRASNDLDFSFSGLKTAVRNTVAEWGGTEKLSFEQKKDIAREFEDTVTDVLAEKTLRAMKERDTKTLIVGGGVAANTFIKKRLEELCADKNVILLVCPPIQATDNALMIALAGYFRAQRKEFIEIGDLKAQGNLRLR